MITNIKVIFEQEIELRKSTFHTIKCWWYETDTTLWSDNETDTALRTDNETDTILWSDNEADTTLWSLHLFQHLSPSFLSPLCITLKIAQLLNYITLKYIACVTSVNLCPFVTKASNCKMMVRI